MELNSINLNNLVNDGDITKDIELDSDTDLDFDTNTSCSGNSEDCIEYDSDLSSTNSIFFYSDNDEFIDNHFLRINHTPFMKLMKNNKHLINKILPDLDITDEESDISMSKILKNMDDTIYDQIDNINKQIEVSYNHLCDLIKKNKIINEKDEKDEKDEK